MNVYFYSSGLDLSRDEVADSLDFDMNLKTNPIGMIQTIEQKRLDFSKIELELENNIDNNDLFG